MQKRSIVSADDFEADKESLVRMLEDFRKDNATRKVVRPPFLQEQATIIKCVSLNCCSRIHQGPASCNRSTRADKTKLKLYIQ